MEAFPLQTIPNQSAALPNSLQGRPLATTPESTDPQDAAALAAADFESFLQLLTAQISNQDPLSPLESTQFVEQLASFSALEQQIQTNERLDQISALVSGTGLAGEGMVSGYAHLIGSHIVTSETTAEFTGDPVHFSIPDLIRINADEGDFRLEIHDANGNEVRQLSSVNGTIASWNGKLGDGSMAAPGQYELAITQTGSDGQKNIVGRGLVLSQVREVHNQPGGAVLVLENGQTTPLDMIEGFVSSDSIKG